MELEIPEVLETFLDFGLLFIRVGIIVATVVLAVEVGDDLVGGFEGIFVVDGHAVSGQGAVAAGLGFEADDLYGAGELSGQVGGEVIGVVLLGFGYG